MPPSQTVIARCRELAAISDTAGGTLRTFLSPAMKRCYQVVGGWMTSAGMTVSVDAACNLRGVLRTAGSGEPTLLLGSHLDTVPDAGAFDGVLGIIIGITLAESFRDRALPFDIEVIGFSDEEGVRFGVPFIGSRGLVGSLDEPTLNRTDSAGVTVAQAICNFGAITSFGERCVPHPHSFLEFHIEQGPVLDGAGESVGIVETIAGQSRALVKFVGSANHAGTTPMRGRRDSLAAAAQWVTAVEDLALATPGLVATNGKIDVLPGAGNVIAAEVTVSLDLRHGEDRVRTRAFENLQRAAADIAANRRLELIWTDLLDQKAVHLDARLMDALAAASPPGTRRMVSGAGHDAMILAPHIPSAMLFLRSPGGISHHPAENALAEDVDAALAIGRRFIESLSVEK